MTEPQETFLRNQLIHELDHLLIDHPDHDLTAAEQEVLVLARESARLDHNPEDKENAIDVSFMGEEPREGEREEDNLIDSWSHPYLGFILSTDENSTLTRRVENAIEYVQNSGLYPELQGQRIDLARVEHTFARLEVENRIAAFEQREGKQMPEVGKANMRYIAESRHALGVFGRQLTEPVLLRLPYGNLANLTTLEKDWLRLLNGVNNLFIEFYDLANPITALGRAYYREVGLEEIYERNQASGNMVKPGERNSKNTITLLTVDRGKAPEFMERIIREGGFLKNSVLVPIGLITRDGQTARGDSLGLIRGALFGFRLLSIARNPEETLIVEARSSYESLIGAQSGQPLEITFADILALAMHEEMSAEDMARLLLKMTAGIVEEPLDINEQLEIFKYADEATAGAA